MAWKKPLPELVKRFSDALPRHPDAEPKKMFGYPACFVKGNFFAGLHEENFVIRLPGPLKERFPQLKDAPIFDPMNTGKGMKDWWTIPAEISGSDQQLSDFLEAAFFEVLELPPKAVKPKKPKAAQKRQKAK
jgi:TfoX/Sxy family transcriptional regulator of competence genes